MPIDSKLAQNTLAAAAKELDDARIAYETAHSQYLDASRVRTETLNRLNAIQKKFDAAVKTVKDEAPRDSDWKQMMRAMEGV